MGQITFKDKPVSMKPEQAILLNGEEVGWVIDKPESAGGSRFHTGLYLDVGSLCYGKHLIQGFGDTLQASIDNCLDKAIAFADRMRVEAYSLMDQMHSKDEVDS